MNLSTLNIEIDNKICYIQIFRPNDKNSINKEVIEDLNYVFEKYVTEITIFVISGTKEFFCNGSDLNEVNKDNKESQMTGESERNLYNIWLKMLSGPYIVISHVKGITNAGGIGFLAASDIVIADDTATFSLSELLFGLYPAMVLPFLIRKIGHQRAKYLTLITNKISVQQAYSWGLVDAYDKNSDLLLKKHLMRLKCLRKDAIYNYKKYMNKITDSLENEIADIALNENKKIFLDEDNINSIKRYVEDGLLPWEGIN